MRFVVRPGERIAADGVVISGHSAIDKSFLTGEPIPEAVQPGDEVTGATLNTNRSLDGGSPAGGQRNSPRPNHATAGRSRAVSRPRATTGGSCQCRFRSGRHSRRRYRFHRLDASWRKRSHRHRRRSCRAGGGLPLRSGLGNPHSYRGGCRAGCQRRHHHQKRQCVGSGSPSRHRRHRQDRYAHLWPPHPFGRSW